MTAIFQPVVRMYAVTYNIGFYGKSEKFNTPIIFKGLLDKSAIN